VLGADGRVVGFVTVDDDIDAAVQQQTDTVLRMRAVKPGARARLNSNRAPSARPLPTVPGLRGLTE
jgi:hypothetical protein